MGELIAPLAMPQRGLEASAFYDARVAGGRRVADAPLQLWTSMCRRAPQVWLAGEESNAAPREDHAEHCR